MSEAGGDQHQHHDGHDERQRVKDVTTDVDPAGLEGAAQGLKSTEQIGTEKRETRPPKPEDHQGDGDPAGSLGHAIDPVRNDGEAVANAAHACEQSTDDGVDVAVFDHVDAHCVCSLWAFANCAELQSDAGAEQVDAD